MATHFEQLLADIRAFATALANHDSVQSSINTDELIARMINVCCNCNLDDIQRHQLYELVSSLGGISPDHGDPFLACLEDMSLEENTDKIKPETMIVPEEPQSSIWARWFSGDLCV